MLQSTTIDSLHPWKHLLVIWSIHGNEKAWSLWIEKFLEHFRWKMEIILKWWKITCIPYANWEAWKNNVRYIEHNANRLFNQQWSTTEHHAVHKMKKYIEQCDFILDLHTYHFGKWSFLFDDMETREWDTVLQTIPVDQVILWWNDLYTESDSWMDTTAYGKSLWIPGTTVECWYHWDLHAVDVAYNSIINVWIALWILDWAIKSPEKTKRRIRMEKIVWKDPNSKFVKHWEHGDKINANEGIYTSWDTLIKNWPEEKVMIIPFHEATEKDEWFYLGKEEV
jgi:predicted deacylase